MKTMLNIKIDTKLKIQAKKTAEEMGIPLGTIASALLRQFVREREINLSVDYKPSPSLIKALKESEEDYKRGDFQGPFKDVKSLMASLNK